uniref:Uncharacterized protein n=1 Tax=Rhizophora mucronata TaxID=61149 RepID=A0A2P2KIX9_RHIMU
MVLFPYMLLFLMYYNFVGLAINCLYVGMITWWSLFEIMDFKFPSVNPFYCLLIF